MEKEVVSPIDALEARARAEKAEANTLDIAYNQIRYSSEMGFNEVTIDMCFLSLKNVQVLMNKGFAVSEVTHPFACRKVHKISW